MEDGLTPSLQPPAPMNPPRYSLFDPAAVGLATFLGSPLGPALRAGDPEALSWLQSLAQSGPGARKISLIGAKSRPFFRA